MKCLIILSFFLTLPAIGSSRCTKIIQRLFGTESRTLRVEKRLQKTTKVRKSNVLRGRLFRRYFHTNDEEKYLELLWQSHDNMDVTHWEGVRGRNSRVRRAIDRLRVRNYSKYVPSYFKFYDDKETYGIIEAIVEDVADKEGQKALSKKGREAIEEFELWMEEAQNYRTDLENIVREGFRAKEDMLALNPRMEHLGILTSKRWLGLYPEALVDWLDLGKSYAKGRGSKPWSDADFRNEDMVPFVEILRPDGSKDRINLPSRVTLNVEFNQRRDTVHNTFTQRFWGDMFKNSDVYERMIEQALMLYRLEYLYESLIAKIPSERTEVQKQIIERVKTLLETPKYRTRSDVVAKAQWKIFRNEIRAAFKRQKSRSKFFEGSKFQPSDDFMEAATKSPVIKNALTLAAGGSILATSYYQFLTLVLQPLNENPWLGYPGSATRLGWNLLWLYTVGDLDLRNCAKKTSGHGKCYQEVLSKYTGYFELLERRSQDLHQWEWGKRQGLVKGDQPYDMADEPFIEYISAYLYKHLFDRREELRMSHAERALSGIYMREVLRSLDDFMLGFYIATYESKVPQAEEFFYQFIELKEAGDEDGATALLEKIRTINEEFAMHLESYGEGKNRDDMAKKLEQQGIWPDGTTLDNIFQELGVTAE